MIVYKSKSYSNCRTNAKWILNQAAFWLAVEIWFLVEIIDFSVMYAIYIVCETFTIVVNDFLCAIQWNNAYLIHFGAFLYFCFPSSSLYLSFPLIFLFRIFFHNRVQCRFRWSAFNLIYSHFFSAKKVCWMPHILFSCYKFNVDYVYRGCHKSVYEMHLFRHTIQWFYIFFYSE